MGNKYRIGRKIGSGSFGDIYLGEDLVSARSPSITDGPQAPTLSLAKRLPSNLRVSKPSILSSSMKPASTNHWQEEWASPSCAGSGPSATTMQWSSTS